MAGFGSFLGLGSEGDACNQFCTEVLEESQRWGPASERFVYSQLPAIMLKMYSWLGLSSPGLEEGLLRVFHPAGPLLRSPAASGAPAFVFPLDRLPPRVVRAAVLTAATQDMMAQGSLPLRWNGDVSAAALGLQSGLALSLGLANRLGHRPVPQQVSRLPSTRAAWLEGNSRSSSSSSAGLAAVAQDQRFSGPGETFGSTWFTLLGPDRLARSPEGGVEGVSLTVQEFVIVCMIYYLVWQGNSSSAPTSLGTPLASILQGTGSGSSNPSASTSQLGGLPEAGGSMGYLGSDSAGGFGGGRLFGLGSRQGSKPNVSVSYERMLLAYLEALLPHRDFEIPAALEPRATYFFLHLLAEFHLQPQPPPEVLPGRSTSEPLTQDARAQPAALHAARLVALHILANPALRRSAEVTRQEQLPPLSFSQQRQLEEMGLPGMRWDNARLPLRSGAEDMRGIGRVTQLYPWPRLTREVALLGPALLDLIRDLLQGHKEQRFAGLENLTSLLRLWLVFLQPWKAPRLYAWYASLRPPQPCLEPPTSTIGATFQSVGKLLTAPGEQPDVALLGLEPECPPGNREVPLPTVPRAAGGSHAQAATGTVAAAATPLIPGAGDARSWRGYVLKFQDAYDLLPQFLALPTHCELCVQLASHLAGESSGGFVGAAGAALASTIGEQFGFGRAQELMRQPHIVCALKALAQALLCFSDSLLLSVLAPDDPSSRLATASNAATPLFTDDGVIRMEAMTWISLTWAALLCASSNPELQYLLAAVSRQLQHSQHWLPVRLPALEDTDVHQAFAKQALEEVRKEDATLGVQARGPASGVGASQRPPYPSSLRSEWQKPVRSGEAEFLLQVAYRCAYAIDRLLGRDPKSTSSGLVPQTEWPRVFANWWVSSFVFVILLAMVF